MVRAGELPENRKYLRLYLTECREGLIENLGPTEQDLTAAQVILVDRVICKLGVLRCIEEHIREAGVMKGQDLAPALRDSYLHYSREVRLDLVVLGIKTKAGEGVIDLTAYLKAHDAARAQGKAKDAEKSQAKARKARPEAVVGQGEAGGPGRDDKAGLGVVPLRGSGDDISGQQEGGIDNVARDGQDQDPESAGIVQSRGLHNEGEEKDDDRETNLS